MKHEVCPLVQCLDGRVQGPSSLTCASFLTLEGHLSFESELRKIVGICSLGLHFRRVWVYGKALKGSGIMGGKDGSDSGQIMVQNRLKPR
jgi:hypothetical protein